MCFSCFCRKLSKKTSISEMMDDEHLSHFRYAIRIISRGVNVCRCQAFMGNLLFKINEFEVVQRDGVGGF